MNQVQYNEFKEELLTKGFFHCSNDQLAIRLYEDVKLQEPTLYLYRYMSFSYLKVMTAQDIDFLSQKKVSLMQEVQDLDAIMSHLMPSRSEENVTKTITLTEGREWDRQGDRFLVKSFLECCDAGALTDDDGHAQGLLLHGKLVYDGTFEPSRRDEYGYELLRLAQDHPQLIVLWFNK